MTQQGDLSIFLERTLLNISVYSVNQSEYYTNIILLASIKAIFTLQRWSRIFDKNPYC